MALKDNTYNSAVPTCKTIIEQNDRKETNIKKTNRKIKVKGASFFFCKVINTWGRIKVVQLTLQRSFVLSIHAAHDFHKQQRVFIFSGKKKATVQAFHDDDIHIQRFEKF